MKMTKNEWIETLINHLAEIEDLIQYFPGCTAGWRILATADDNCRQLIMELTEAEGKDAED